MTLAEAEQALAGLVSTLSDVRCEDDQDAYLVCWGLRDLVGGWWTHSDAAVLECRMVLCRLIYEGKASPAQLEAFELLAADTQRRYEEAHGSLVEEMTAEGVCATLAGDLYHGYTAEPDERLRTIAQNAAGYAANLVWKRQRAATSRPPRFRGRPAVSRRMERRPRRREHRALQGRCSRASPARPAGDDEPPADLATRLQRAQQQLARSVLEARELDEHGFRVFVDFAAAVIAREAARVTRWEQRQ